MTAPKPKIRNQVLACLVFLAFVNAQVAPLVTVVTNAVPLSKGASMVVPWDSVLLEREFANKTLDQLRFYLTNYPLVASNFEAAVLTIKAQDREIAVEKKHSSRLEVLLDKTDALLKKAQDRLARAHTIGEVLLGVGVVIGIGLVVAGIMLAAELAKSMNITVH